MSLNGLGVVLVEVVEIDLILENEVDLFHQQNIKNKDILEIDRFEKWHLYKKNMFYERYSFFVSSVPPNGVQFCRPSKLFVRFDTSNKTSGSWFQLTSINVW